MPLKEAGELNEPCRALRRWSISYFIMVVALLPGIPLLTPGICTELGGPRSEAQPET